MNPSFEHGYRDARTNLGRGWPLAAALLGVLVVGTASLLELASLASAERTRQLRLDVLQGASLGLVLPLFAFAAMARIGVAPEALMAAVWARHGADRRAYGLGQLAWGALLATSVAGVSVLLAVALTGGTSSGWLALGAAVLFGGASYAAGLALARVAFGRFAPLGFLVLDWMLGSGIGFAALPWPRSHVRALLGGSAVLNMSPAASAQWLFGLAVLCTLLYARRLPR